MCLTLLTGRIMGSKSGCMRSQEIPWHFAGERGHWGCCNRTSVPAVIHSYNPCMCIVAYFKKFWNLFFVSMQIPLFVLLQHAILAIRLEVSLFTMKAFMSVWFLKFSNIL